MVGSTVVIGLPDDDESSVSRYYLGAKVMNLIDMVGNNGTLVNAPWSTQSAATGTKTDNDDPEWKRSLYIPTSEGNHRRLLETSNESIQQNDTHTTLSFTRPLRANDNDPYATSVQYDDLNTFIWAVGSSNDFGYHGGRRGSHTLQFSSECGTLAPMVRMIQIANDDFLVFYIQYRKLMKNIVKLYAMFYAQALAN